MKHTKIAVTLLLVLIAFTSCENYSNGDRVGYVTKFSKKGTICKTWEGHLNMTQTGNNSADGWDFSIDGDGDYQSEINTLDSAVEHGYKVKLTYHQTKWKNYFSNRGETDYFVTKVEVLK